MMAHQHCSFAKYSIYPVVAAVLFLSIYFCRSLKGQTVAKHNILQIQQDNLESPLGLRQTFVSQRRKLYRLL